MVSPAPPGPGRTSGPVFNWQVGKAPGRAPSRTSGEGPEGGVSLPSQDFPPSHRPSHLLRFPLLLLKGLLELKPHPPERSKTGGS